MSTSDPAARNAGPEVRDPDDWDLHWDSHGAAVEGGPANIYRRRLIVSLLGGLPAGATLLDIGCGQGELAIYLRETNPNVTVWGLDYSAAGVERGRALAQARGANVTFIQRDLLQPVTLASGQPAADFAVCSEVLEHVDDPDCLLRNAKSLLAPGCQLVVTVPGGPRSAFDCHLGHRRHFTAADLERMLTQAGFHVERVLRAGFPFWNLYRLAVIARGRRLVAEIETRAPGANPPKLETLATSFFNAALRHTWENFPLGWQMAAVACVPAADQA
jgi:2-polyprenyl-3-methyl-5-hydroxy-6-metoxy-1,4-benzoquinol methylase